MPIKDKVVKEADCDVCGKCGAETCAICGGVFCSEHSILIEFKREDFVLKRRLCKKCLAKPVSPNAVIRKHCPQSWKGQLDCPPELLDFITMQTDESSWTL